MKRVFIVHCWGDRPQDNWYPWVKQELEKKGFEVFVPEMPDTDNPCIDLWIPYLKDQVGELDSHTYFIGHSVGCQTILRYLAEVKGDIQIGGVILVAPWVQLTGIDDPEEYKVIESWIENPFNIEKVKDHCSKIVTIFSDNDPFVSLDHETFEKKLDSRIIVESKKGHFTKRDDGIYELPIVVEELLKL